MNKHLITKTIIAADVFFLLLLTSENASAQLSQNITVANPKALSMGHAVTADPPGIDSIHFNPAGLINLQGRRVTINVIGASLSQKTAFGETNISDEKKQSLCLVTEGCDPSHPEDWENVWPIDTVAATVSESNNASVYVPKSGVQDTPLFFATTGGMSYSDPSNSFTFASSVYSPMSSGFKRNENDPASFHGIRSASSRITYLSPSLAYRVSERFTVGVSIGFSYHGMAAETNFRGPELSFAYINEFAGDLEDVNSSLLRFISPYDPIGRLEFDLEDEFSPSFNIGFLWEITPWLTLGGVYQSEAVSNMKGTWRMNYSSEVGEMISSLVPLNAVTNLALGASFEGPENRQQCLDDTVQAATADSCSYSQSGKIKTDFVLPQHIALGVSMVLYPGVKVNVDFKWTDYSAWDVFEFDLDKSADFLVLSHGIYVLNQDEELNTSASTMQLPRHYESSLTWALGVEYQIRDNLGVRFGIEPRGNSVPKDRLDLGVPLVDGYLYGLGGYYVLEDSSKLDIGIGYWKSEFDLDYGESKNSNSNEPGKVIYNPYATLDYSSSAEIYMLAVSLEKPI